MPQEREYAPESDRRTLQQQQELLLQHKKNERNKAIIDNYGFQNPDKLSDPAYVSKSDAVREQDDRNIRDAREFSQTHFHNLVDIAISEAAAAGKSIIDARDFTEDDKTETEAVPETADQGSINLFELLEGKGRMHVLGKESLVQARLEKAIKYCESKGYDPENLTKQEAMAIILSPEWQDLSAE